MNTCDRCHSPIEPGDLRCPICARPTPPTHQVGKVESKVTLLRCTGCGAAMTYDADLRSPACSFCGEALEVQTIIDPMEQTEVYLPMTVTIQQAQSVLRDWLDSRGWFRPSDLSSASILTEIKPLWWVAWIFDAEATVSWTADSDAGAGRSAWAPHAGQDTIRFDRILVSGSRGLTNAEVDAIAPGMNLGTGTDSPRGGGDHPTLERFDVPRSLARQQVSTAIQRTAAVKVQREHIPGTRFRNVHVSIVVRRLITRRYSLPAYVLAYRYRDRGYRVVICGQDARYIVGSSPFSNAKLFALIGGIVLVVVILLLAMIATS